MLLQQISCAPGGGQREGEKNMQIRDKSMYYGFHVQINSSILAGDSRRAAGVCFPSVCGVFNTPVPFQHLHVAVPSTHPTLPPLQSLRFPSATARWKVPNEQTAANIKKEKDSSSTCSHARTRALPEGLWRAEKEIDGWK